MGINEKNNLILFFDRDGVLVKLKNNQFNELVSQHNLTKSSLNIDLFETVTTKYKNKCFMITNQPDVSRGKISLKTVVNDNEFVKEYFNLVDYETCVHDDHDNCNCRKPKDGMLKNLISKYNLSKENIYMIGDRPTDIEAALMCGVKSIFVDYGIYNLNKLGANIISSFSNLNYTLKRL